METSSGDLITLAVPARAEFVQVLRTVTASVASRIPVTFDGIEDLRLAVDEACARLLAIPGEPTVMTLALRPLPDRLEVAVGVDVSLTDPPPVGLEATLGWRVLTVLVDAVTLDVDGAGASIRFSKPAPEPVVPSAPT